MCLDTLADKLKMETLGPQSDAVCGQVAKRNVDYRAFLAEAFQAGEHCCSDARS